MHILDDSPQQHFRMEAYVALPVGGVQLEAAAVLGFFIGYATQKNLQAIQ